MPRVKVDYVVSFSSEDSEHPASNLLSWEVSKKKWLCKKGESSCSVVLQLTKAVKISAVHVGVHHAALVEVLVARSETSSDQYQVLVPSSVFVSPGESRKDQPVERVRSFSSAQLSDAQEHKWDRVRVVCSQPYNKHCKYGLSFIHIDEVGDDTTKPTINPASSSQASSEVKPSIPQRLLTLDTMSSDEDDFRPGELFAKHVQKKTGDEHSGSSTDAQIRQATSQALKNLPNSSTKLTKTPINKPSVKRDSGIDHKLDRTRDTLLYTDDDERPHAKIDQLVKRHHDEKERQEKAKPVVVKHDKKERKGDRTKTDGSSRHKDDKKRDASHDRRNESKRSDDRSHSDDRKHDYRLKFDGNNTSRHKEERHRDEPPTRNRSAEQTRGHSSSERNKDDSRKRRRSNDNDQGVSAEPHTLLRGAVLVLSGYENPRRAAVRDIALALGARVQRDWGPTCTHLICAFPNTPKLRAVRAQAGPDVPAARAEWLEESSRVRRLLPWRWFATEKHHLVQRPEPQPEPDREPATDPDCDTDDEIERVLQNQKKRRTLASPPPPTPKSPNDKHQSRTDRTKSRTDDDDDTIVEADGVDVDSSDLQLRFEDSDDACTEEEDEEKEEVRARGGLACFLEGLSVALDARAPHREQLARYVRAYGGVVLELSELSSDSEVDYVLLGEGATGAGRGVRGAKRVTAAWLSRCHERGELLPCTGD